MSQSSVCHYCQDHVPVQRSLDSIIVHGACEYNLKHICFALPKNKLVALTGLSGSGKSSIATDILQKECIRQYLESMGMTTDHIEKAKVDMILGLSPSIGVSQRAADTNPRSTVGTKTGILAIVRNMFAALGQQLCSGCDQRVKQPLQDTSHMKIVEIEEEQKDASIKKRKKSYFLCPHCQHELEKLTMSHFSSNTLDGSCQECKGIGQIVTVNTAALLDENLTMGSGGVRCWDVKTAHYYQSVILAASKHYNFSFDANKPIKDYSPFERNFLLYGIEFPEFVRLHKGIKPPKKASEGNFEGVATSLLQMYIKNPLTAAESVKKYITHAPCDACQSSGLSPLARSVTVGERTITDVAGLSLDELLQCVQGLQQQFSAHDQKIFMTFAGALQDRISYLIEVGLQYVSLDRSIPSLSGGELQRLRLANLLGSGLTGVLYVVDEPTTGLHPHDTAKLLAILRKIQQAGNTVLVIEHDMDLIKTADYIIDMGPGGGSCGGQIIARGTVADIMACSTSITGQYLSKKAVVRTQRISGDHDEKLVVRGAAEHNLQNIDVTIPFKSLVVLTGVSGSGKSSFLFDIVDKAARVYFNQAAILPGKYKSIEGFEYCNRIVTVHQSPVGNTKSSRSNVATYTKMFDHIRDLFAAQPAAKNRRLQAEDFSFNNSAYRCENCHGAGVVEVDMTFMPDIEMECPACHGKRFDTQLLAIELDGKNIADVLELSVEQALPVFKAHRKISAILEILEQMGLHYLKLGQSTNTLSGGQAQRIKLAAELSKSQTANTLYLLDEPTTGLHLFEVQKLIDILRMLVAKGNSVLIIEHNLDIMCAADTIIDFGPGGGSAGGTIVASGTPQDIMAQPNSLTGQCLQEYVTR